MRVIKIIENLDNCDETYSFLKVTKYYFSNNILDLNHIIFNKSKKNLIHKFNSFKMDKSDSNKRKIKV